MNRLLEGNMAANDKDILLKWANLLTIEKKDNYLRLDTALECIKKIQRAHMLATNARMLSTGVIPSLCNDVSSAYFDILYDKDDMKQKLLEQLLESNKDHFMYSFPARRYMSLHAMRDLNATERNDLLDIAFVHLNAKSMSSLLNNANGECGSFTMVEKALEAQERSETMTSNFDKCVMAGFCTKDPDQTPTAMYYLIGKGSTFPLSSSKGLAFEKSVALHIIRFYESQKYSVSLHTLKTQFPNKSGVDTISDEWSEMKRISSDMNVIVQPLKSNAAGPDIIVQRNSYTDGSTSHNTNKNLDLYQVKNLRPSTSIDAGRVSRCLFLNGTHENKNEKNDTKNVEMLLKGVWKCCY